MSAQFIEAELLAWHTGGAAKAVTGSYVVGDTLEPADSNVLTLCITVDTSDRTTLECQVHTSSDGAASWWPVSTVDTPTVSGVATVNTAVWQCSAANGSRTITMRTPIGRALRILLKGTGGSAANALVYAERSRDDYAGR